MAPRSFGGLRAGVMLAAFAALSFALSPAEAVQPTKDKKTTLLQQGFSDVHLDATPSLTTFHGRDVSASALAQSPGLAALDGFFGDASREWEVRWDARGDRPHLIQGAGYPLLPGAGNRLSFSEVGLDAGRKIGRDDVEGAVRGFMARYPDLLRVDPTTLRLDPVRSVTVGNGRVWFIELQQFYRGVPVEGANVFFRINNGNIVQFGADRIGDVHGIRMVPRSNREPAFAAVLQQLGIDRSQVSEILDAGTLKIYPGLAASEQPGHDYRGVRGGGYAHRLGWEFTFRRQGDPTTYQAVVDARTHSLLRIVDLTRYASVTAGIYPTTNTDAEVVVNMPFCSVTNNGNQVTDAGGNYNYSGGTATSTLNGQYFTMSDACGGISLAGDANGNINFGTSGGTDCTTPGVGGAGNTHASRSGFYHLTNINRKAAGFFPGNSWLASKVTANMNINQTCNAFWNGTTVNFYKSGGGCRNTGEIAAVFDHEWGHGLDDNDTGGSLSNPSEAYADIASIYRLEASCVGHGFSAALGGICGNTPDGTGSNEDEAQVGASHCDLDCGGVRDADWDKHADHTPDTALGFVCPKCLPSSGPCGRQVHCAAAPPRQAAWDLTTRDLTSPPFNMSSETAFITGNRIFYLGSGNIGAWYSCTCGSSSGGCGATNGYMQWLGADDNDGNLNNGTPHMTALFAAFNRHGIACATPPPQNSACEPSGTPTVTATSTLNTVTLNWTAVAGATGYWVYRSEGHAGCNFGKTKIADVAGLSYFDKEVARNRTYYYNVVAHGSSQSCFGAASTCLTVTPGGPALEASGGQ